MTTEVHDLVVVGSGAAGLVAAITAHRQGLKPLVIEKADVWGGTSALSGGGLWIPNNHLMQADGAADSQDDALLYMESVIAEVGAASSRERKLAFLKNAPLMARELEDCGFRWQRAPSYPDYYPAMPGARVGRVLEGQTANAKALGPWLATMRRSGLPPLALSTTAAPAMATLLRTPKTFATIAGVAARTLGLLAIGRHPLAIGETLVAQLMMIVQKLGIEVRLGTPLQDLIWRDGHVAGVSVGGSPGDLFAPRGVILCAGGFAHNRALRMQHQQVSGDWSSASPDDTGDAILTAARGGAQLALMDDAWWGPSFVDSAGKPKFILSERTLPGSIIVDGSGHRYFNEAESYIDAGHAMLERHRTTPAIPSWFIMDSRYRGRYMFGQLPPGIMPKALIESGFMLKAETLADLARACGINPTTLATTIERFNAFARAGVDKDFDRGGNIYDTYYGDPANKPNASLGAIAKGPFFACKVYPGDLGTKGGLLTDEHARVVNAEGDVIAGLYAAGNTTASVMGRTYPGPGSTLGPATTFAFIAARHAAGKDAL